MIKPLRYLSVCSGIEAASVAWHPLGWQPWAFAEIDPFPSAVLVHRFPGVPNLGDMTKFENWPDESVDLLVGGTPCQDYSVAGRRAGMAGERGQLTCTFVAIARRYRPRWIIWENVPGVLSSNGGRDFATFLRDLGECGYGWAYRVLDAQYVQTCAHRGAVPQRRHRVFVIGYLGDWRPPAAVCLEPEGLRGDSPPRREAGQRPALTFAARTRGGGGLGTDFDLDGGLITMAHGQGGAEIGLDHVPTLTCTHEAPIVAGALCADSFSGGAGGRPEGAAAGHFLPLVSMAFDCKGSEAASDTSGAALTLRAMGHLGILAHAGGQLAVASDAQAGGETGLAVGDVAGALHGGGKHGGRAAVATRWAVRRLTPMECERLQGFPDGWTDVPYRRRSYTPDGPRYKALGNSMAVNCMEWIGRRIELVREVMDEAEAEREARTRKGNR